MRDNGLLWQSFLGKDDQFPPSSKLFQTKYNFRRGKYNVTKLFCCLYILVADPRIVRDNFFLE